MSGPYEVIWETSDGKTHFAEFPYEDHSLRHACDYCYSLRKRNDVVRGHVYAISRKQSFASFDKEDL